MLQHFQSRGTMSKSAFLSYVEESFADIPRSTIAKLCSANRAYISQLLKTGEAESEAVAQ